MALTAKSSGGGDFDIAPAGNHVAICYGVVDLGEHEQEWQGKVSLKHRVRISWELCDELMSDGRPFSISKEYTLSLNEKATLRHDLESWRGRPFTDAELSGFDIFVLLGKPCMVNVVHKPKRDGSGGYAAVSSVAAIPKGMPARDQVNPSIRFSMEEDGAQEVFNGFPDWLKNKIRWPSHRSAMDEYDALASSDDCPF